MKHFETKDIAKKNQQELPIHLMQEKKEVRLKPYEKWTKDDLYEQAKKVDIKGRSKMDKDVTYTSFKK